MLKQRGKHDAVGAGVGVRRHGQGVLEPEGEELGSGGRGERWLE